MIGAALSALSSFLGKLLAPVIQMWATFRAGKREQRLEDELEGHRKAIKVREYKEANPLPGDPLGAFPGVYHRDSPGGAAGLHDGDPPAADPDRSRK